MDWVDIDNAIDTMSKSLTQPHIGIDEYQIEQFQQYHIQKRDPMYISMTILQDIKRLDTIDNIISASVLHEII